MRDHAAPRLYLDAVLADGVAIAADGAQASYLLNVLRLGAGDAVLVFNGRDGEWRARLSPRGKRGCELVPEALVRTQAGGPDIDYLFAPLKRARLDYMVQKATELGVGRLQPVITRRTVAERVNVERMRANVIEAAEQCGGTFVPEVDELQPLDRLLDRWPADRRILWCDEHLAGRSSALTGLFAGVSDDAPQGGRAAAGPWAILIGPEGGFAGAEQARLRAMPQTVPVALGPRILRADTAAVAALALWQAALGDWGGESA